MNVSKTHFKFYYDIRWNVWFFGLSFWGRDYISEANFYLGPLRVGVWITKGVF